MGASVYQREGTLMIFGGMPAGDSAPSDNIYLFDTQALTWGTQTPSGEDRPLGRMWHAVSPNQAGTQMLVYGGINCYELVIITTEEMGSVQYKFSLKALEYQQAMEDVWAIDFVQWIWVE